MGDVLQNKICVNCKYEIQDKAYKFCPHCSEEISEYIELIDFIYDEVLSEKMRSRQKVTLEKICEDKLFRATDIKFVVELEESACPSGDYHLFALKVKKKLIEKE